MNDSGGQRNGGQVARKDADQKYCYSCGVVIHFSAHHCPSCGAMQSQGATSVPVYSAHPIQDRAIVALPPNHVYCRGCGAAIHESALNCPKCGALQRGTSGFTSSGGRDRMTAALLAFFLGGFGAHKFYLGSGFMGVIYLLFCWTFIPAFFALIEGIIYLTMSDHDFNRKFN